ncbi:hypothetical protein [Rossellomorea marisflavi]|uniref:hypothetical protein n=1 Tax=Rossellomorea marisflavi TaxID=189381 RepID=UPI003D2F28DF
MQKLAVHAHIITLAHAVPLLKRNRSALFVEITDGTDYGYRANLYYSLAKVFTIHLAAVLATELADKPSPPSPSLQASFAVKPCLNCSECRKKTGGKVPRPPPTSLHRNPRHLSEER